MTATQFFLLVVVFFASMIVQVAIAAWLCGTNTRVEAAQDAAADAELQEIIEAGR